MIVLDTHVLSEPLRKIPSQQVVDWLDNQDAETLYITSVSRAELRFGVLRLPNGRRKNALAARIERALELFKDLTLAIDSVAADQLAKIAAECEKNGRRALAPDAYIAACAAARGFAVATRNGNHFEHFGVPLVDPWQ